MNPSRRLSNRLKIIQNLWQCCDGLRVRFVGFYPLDRNVGSWHICDTHSPWQKGGVENAIGRMRRPLPRKTDLRTLTQEQLDAHAAAYNNTPRKCLGFRTPAEVFLGFLQPLHFNRESISPPSRG